MSDIVSALRRLAADSRARPRSKIEQLRNIYDEIVSTQKAGATLGEILKELNSYGMNIPTLTTFKSMIRRIRLKRASELKKNTAVFTSVPEVKQPGMCAAQRESFIKNLSQTPPDVSDLLNNK